MGEVITGQKIIFKYVWLVPLIKVAAPDVI